jgi:hypothetical protein
MRLRPPLGGRCPAVSVLRSSLSGRWLPGIGCCGWRWVRLPCRELGLNVGGIEGRVAGPIPAADVAGIPAGLMVVVRAVGRTRRTVGGGAVVVVRGGLGLGGSSAERVVGSIVESDANWIRRERRTGGVGRADWNGALGRVRSGGRGYRCVAGVALDAALLWRVSVRGWVGAPERIRGPLFFCLGVA